MISTSLSLTYEAKLRLLLILDPKARLGQLNTILAQEVDVLELETKSIRVSKTKWIKVSVSFICASK